MSRPDGRSNADLRILSLTSDSLAKVDGSARFGFGSFPQTIATVSGPIEVRLAAEQPSKATLETHIRPISGVSASESKAMANALAAALLPSLILTQTPRTLIQLVIQALTPSLGLGRWRDGLVASMINSSTMALMNAGSVPMKGVVCAVCIGQRDGTFIVDPSDDELPDLSVGGCFAFLFADGRVDAKSEACVWTNWRSLKQTGYSEEELKQATDQARKASREIWMKMKEYYCEPLEVDEAKMEYDMDRR